MEVIIDGSKIKTIEDFHREIKRVLDLPDYYGENLDALWDCLTGWVELPISLVWKDFEICEPYIGEYAFKAMSLFEDAEKEIVGFYFLRQ